MGAGLDLHASVDLAAKVGDLSGAVRDLSKAIVLPTIPRQLEKTVVTPTGVTSPFIVVLGTPSDAVIWDLRTLTLVGSDDHTSVANVTAAVYTGQPFGAGQPSGGAVVLSDVRWTGLAVPSSQTWNAQIVALRKQALFVAFSGTGVVAGVTLGITGMVIEVQAEDANRYFS